MKLTVKQQAERAINRARMATRSSFVVPIHRGYRFISYRLGDVWMYYIEGISPPPVEELWTFWG